MVVFDLQTVIPVMFFGDGLGISLNKSTSLTLLNYVHSLRGRMYQSCAPEKNILMALTYNHFSSLWVTLILFQYV